MHFLHLTFMVRDVEKSIQFYEGFVGLKIQKKFKHGAGDVVFLADQNGATQIELVYVPSPIKVETKGMTVCFENPDLDGIYKKAQENSLNPSDIRNPDPENRYFYVYDPDGISIEFKQKVR